MKKTFIFFFLLMYGIMFAQENMSGTFLETNILPSISGNDCYISFRIPYNKLFFIKEDKQFNTQFSLSFEAIDSVSGKIIREINYHNFSLGKYEETKLANKYFQGIVKLKLTQGVYNIASTYSNENTKTQYYMENFNINMSKSEEKPLFNPLIVSADKVYCNDDSSFILANYEGNIPYSSSGYDLILPVKDTSIESITIEMINNDSTVYKQEIKESFLCSIELLNCANDIICRKSSDLKTRNFIIRKFNLALDEGSLDMNVTTGSKTEKFRKKVVWYDKPFTLKNFNYALRLLRYATDDSEILRLSRIELQKSSKIFNEFWKKLDPTPGSSFNELLEEFYSRADYASNAFSYVNKSGADSDRGKIYIQFGKPDDIKRLYSENKSTQEVWYYKNPYRKFVFIDRSGLGNFILENKPL